MAGRTGAYIAIAFIIGIIIGAAGGYFAAPHKVITKTTTATKTVSSVVTKTVTMTKSAVITKTATKTATVTTTTTASPTTTPKVLKKVTLTVEFGEPWKDLINLAIPIFKQEMKKLGYDVTVQKIMMPYGTNYVAKIASDFAAGTAGDVVIYDSFMTSAFASAGYLLPLDNFVKNWPGWNEYPKAMQDMVKYKGHVYGLMVDTDVRMIWYRKDIFHMAGLPTNWQPKTWKDIFDASLQLKSKAAEIEKALGINEFYPFYIPAGTKWGEGTTMQGFYMVLLGADKPPYNRLYDYKNDKWIGKSTALYRAFAFYIEIYQKLKVGPIQYNFASDVWGTHRKVFAEGKVAMDVGGSWEWAEGWGPKGVAPLKACKAQCSGQSGSAYDTCYFNCEAKYVGYAKMPGFKGGAEGEPKYVTISGGWAIAINAKTPADKREIAWEFIKVVASRDVLAKFAAEKGKICPRIDAVQVPEYANNAYLKNITEYLKFTDFRDALPGYTKVSKIIQQITEEILSGTITDPMTALNKYDQMLKSAVGANNVEELSVNTEPIYTG